MLNLNCDNMFFIHCDVKPFQLTFHIRFQLDSREKTKINILDIFYFV